MLVSSLCDTYILVTRTQNSITAAQDAAAKNAPIKR